MLDEGHHLPWTEEQWASMQGVVQEAARKARVASSFLPLVGPLPAGQASVPKLGMKVQTFESIAGPPHSHALSGEAWKRLEVDDGETLKLATISSNVYLTTQQAEDPDLASARQMLSRAAVVIGRLEDAIVFNGQKVRNWGPPRCAPTLDIYQVQGGDTNPGLLAYPDPNVPATWTWNLTTVDWDPARVGPGSYSGYSENLVAKIVEAIEALEALGQYGPFACVLGDHLYQAANTPSQGSLVLPSDRILPFLGGPLLRSSAVEKDEGVVVALAGSPIDLVVASDVHASYLQRSVEPRYILRVSERFVLRMKQPDAVRRLLAQGKP
ncbi:MAG: hypothetical protein JWM18_3196 [Chloroflexi bacterium]|jgi:uncharacterized linocin/CFP29 family protein|nr:hypothetical protein [Chloroflexota bacterium]